MRGVDADTARASLADREAAVRTSEEGTATVSSDGYEPEAVRRKRVAREKKARQRAKKVAGTRFPVHGAGRGPRCEV